MRKGPTVVMIRDETGKVFGGFASESWRKPTPVWYGSGILLFIGLFSCSSLLTKFTLTTEKSFLYEVKDGQLIVYQASGYNNHFMYLNASTVWKHIYTYDISLFVNFAFNHSILQESLPNGVGMGGQHNFFGWFLSSDFDYGHSNGPCATFESPILSGIIRLV